MEKVSGIIPQAMTYAPQEQPRDEAMVDKILAWHRILEGVYNVRPLPDPGLIAWVSALQYCKQSIMDQAIREWINEHNTAPKPADLLSAYYAIIDKQEWAQKCREHENIRLDADGKVLYKCPYCRDIGYFAQFCGGISDTYNTKMYRCSCNKNEGNLAKALADARWEFDFNAGGFVRRKTWVGNGG